MGDYGITDWFGSIGESGGPGFLESLGGSFDNLTGADFFDGSTIDNAGYVTPFGEGADAATELGMKDITDRSEINWGGEATGDVDFDSDFTDSDFGLQSSVFGGQSTGIPGIGGQQGGEPGFMDEYFGSSVTDKFGNVTQQGGLNNAFQMLNSGAGTWLAYDNAGKTNDRADARLSQSQDAYRRAVEGSDDAKKVAYSRRGQSDRKKNPVV